MLPSSIAHTLHPFQHTAPAPKDKQLNHVSLHCKAILLKQHVSLCSFRRARNINLPTYHHNTGQNARFETSLAFSMLLEYMYVLHAMPICTTKQIQYRTYARFQIIPLAPQKQQHPLRSFVRAPYSSSPVLSGSCRSSAPHLVGLSWPTHLHHGPSRSISAASKCQ